ncbi:GNAT family N-acetyltransferase [Microbacterium sp. RD1]|uniref:GNAT family N-acetyltransferase n=1 Tax=Microbacterium sp. RD1 TaxID=3457313 RepID=UPI003FA53FEF
MTGTGWLPPDFSHPLRADVTAAVHLRPIRAADVDIDMIALAANREMLWRMYGEAWGWPVATITREADREDLARHAAEMVTHESFNYAVLPADESALFGCVYIDPLADAAEQPAAEVSWWVGEEVDPGVRRAVDDFVPRWIGREWPFVRVETPFQHLR